MDYATLIQGSKQRIVGTPDLTEVSTVGVERHNLTMRMALRWFARSTNAFSKKVENHRHAMALYAVWYNFVRPHMSLSRPYATTPAMAAGLTTQLHDMECLATDVVDGWLGRVHTSTNQIRRPGDRERVAGIPVTLSYLDLALRTISVNRP